MALDKTESVSVKEVEYLLSKASNVLKQNTTETTVNLISITLVLNSLTN